MSGKIMDEANRVGMPNFLIIGAGKSGTTSIYRYLKEHPQVYMSPVKEPSFFAFEGERLNLYGPGDDRVQEKFITDINTYRDLFRGVSDEVAIGEASPCYIYWPKTAERIHHHVPDAKLIAILRDPVARAYSDYAMYRRNGRESVEFLEAIRQDQDGTRSDWSWGQYAGIGFYYQGLRRYFDRFNRSQIRVYLYEDLRTDPPALMRDIYRFLGVDDSFAPNTEQRHNVGGIPKNRALHAFMTARNNPVKAVLGPLLPRTLRRVIFQGIVRSNLLRPELSAEVRQELIPVFRDDILRLQDLIDRDLSHWLA